MDLKDKVVVVTGATGGIGYELSKALSSRGAKLILVSRTLDKLDKLISEIGKESVLASFPFDFTHIEKIDDLVYLISQKIDSIDILFNVAGVGVYKNIEDVDLSEWNDSMAINVTTPFYLTKELLPLIKKSSEGIVVNIGSGMGKIPTACRSVYCATKHALRGMTLSLAAEFRGTNVHFVHVALGSTLTEFGPMSLEEKKEENLKGKAYFTPEWVAKRFIEILEKDDFEEEITIYPTEYD